MAQESCNVDKDDAEILKPAASSSPPSSPSTILTSASPLPSPFLMSSDQIQLESTDLNLTVENVVRREAIVVVSPETSVLKTAEEAPLFDKLINRCSICRRKVRLTGFRCRCGDLFCGRHRYSDTHDCSFDYKTAGREEIARENPVVRAAKIIRI